MPKTSFILGNCRHYRAAGRARPFDEAECERGVNIREHVGGPDFGWCARWPCTGGRMARPDNPMVPCEMYDPPTEEEVAESDAEWATCLRCRHFQMAPECKTWNTEPEDFRYGQCVARLGDDVEIDPGREGHVEEVTILRASFGCGAFEEKGGDDE